MSQKKKQLRPVRRYSEELKKHIVKQIESGLITVSQATREYDLKGSQSIYNWIYKYSRTLKKGTVLVVQKESEEKRREQLLSDNKDLEAALGRKQMEIDALKKLIELASSELKVDLKKSFGDKPSKP
jgi:transposase